MNKIVLKFKADSAGELAQLVAGFHMLQTLPPETPSESELMDDAQTLSDEEYDAKNSPEPAPESAPSPAPAKKTRGSRAAPPPIAPSEPPPPPTPAIEYPPLDTLKSIVTDAVRKAQKGEGPKAILELLPKFKDTTGLAFVMEAEDKHRAALYDLVVTADLSIV